MLERLTASLPGLYISIQSLLSPLLSITLPPFDAINSLMTTDPDATGTPVPL